MSLAVLKRKSATKHGSISGGKGFSLNNPRRVDSKSNKVQTQTPMKGNVPRGHGSCCRKFDASKIIKSQYVNYDPFESNGIGTQGISVKNHHGSMAVRHKWMKRGYPYTVVKDTKPIGFDLYLRQKMLQNSSQNFGEKSDARNEDTCEGNENKLCKRKPSLSIVKNVKVMSQSEYMNTKLMKKNCLPPPISKQPCPLPRSGPCVSCSSENPCADGNNNNTNSTETGACANE